MIPASMDGVTSSIEDDIVTKTLRNWIGAGVVGTSVVGDGVTGAGVAGVGDGVRGAGVLPLGAGVAASLGAGVGTRVGEGVGTVGVGVGTGVCTDGSAVGVCVTSASSKVATKPLLWTELSDEKETCMLPDVAVTGLGTTPPLKDPSKYALSLVPS